MSKGLMRAVVNPISIISTDLARFVNQAVAVVGPFFGPYGQLAAAVAAISLQLLYGPKGPKPQLTESSLKTPRPPRVSGYGELALYGAYILYETNEDGKAVDVWGFHDGRIDAITGYMLGDDPVTLAGGYVQEGVDKRYGNDVIQVGANLGLPIETAHAAVVAALPGIWTADHRGDGVVTGYMITRPVKAKNFNEIFPQGGPNNTPLRLTMRMQRVFDWRDPAQSLADPDTWTWTDNNVLALAHYQLFRNNKTWDRHFAPTLAYWTAAADDCDSAVALKAGGTEKRYRLALSHNHTDPHKSVIGNILAAFDGWMQPRTDGALVVYSGRYYAPTVTIGPDDVVSYTMVNGRADEKRVNSYVVTYVSSAHNFNTVETTPWIDESDVIASGAERSETLENAVPSYGQARRLAKRGIQKVLAPKSGSVTTNSGGRAAIGQRYINLRLVEAEGTEFEFVAYDGPAEIVAIQRNFGSGGVTFSWVAADPNIDAWNPATEEGDPAPAGESVVRQPLGAPVINTAVAQFGADVGAGTSGVYITLDVTGPDRDDLTWYIRTRIQGAAVWGEREYTDIDPGATVTLVTEFVPADALVEVETAYEVGDGRVSPWSATETVDTSTAGLGPSAPTDLAATPGAAGVANVSWRNPASSNFSYSRLYRNTVNDFGTATQVGGNRATALGATDSASDTGLAAGTYYYWVRAFTAAGVGSTVPGPASVVVT